MNPDLVVGIATLLIGVGIAIWMVRIRGGAVAMFLGLLLALQGLMSVLTSLMAEGPGKLAMRIVFLVTAVVILMATIRKARQAGQNQHT